MGKVPLVDTMSRGRFFLQVETDTEHFKGPGRGRARSCARSNELVSTLVHFAQGC